MSVRPWGTLWSGRLLGLGLLWASAALAAAPRIALIIDDLGNSLVSGRAALDLPGALTYAFLPHTRYAQPLAQQAHRLGREVMLHLPMEADDGARLGPGGLLLAMPRATLLDTLRGDLASIPHVAGVNNHMGSRLTCDPGAMGGLMEELYRRRLYFIDSRTSARTVAEAMAIQAGVAVGRRHVFLDHDPRPQALRAQFERLLALTLPQGSAIGIGHPQPATLAMLRRELPRLQARGIELVPASRLTQTYLRRPLWHVSSSPSPRVAKSWKLSP